MSGRTRRGVSLLEVLIASVVLAVGSLGTFALLDQVESAHRSLDLSRLAREAYARLAAEIRDAQCDYDGSQQPFVLEPTTTDPGLLASIDAGWIGVDVPIPEASSMTQAGRTDGSYPALAQTVPALRIEYRVALESAPVPVPGGTQPPAAQVGPGFDIQIRVRQITRDPDRDDPTVETGWWIRHYPLHKTCNPRYERSRRGETR